MKPFYLSTILLVSCANLLYAQEQEVRGVVKDTKGIPIAGVTVSSKTNQLKTSTDSEGKFVVSAQPGDVLIFNAIGYEKQEQRITKSRVLYISLSSKDISIDEVVVIGYGTRSKEKLLGSVSTIDSKQLADRPVTNVSTALSGLAAGVQVKQGTGQPGSDGATIRVRGVGTMNNSDALVIIDGIQGTMDAVNPSDIENISVLKDASSAAIYGARAANGVILITTKKGKSGQKPQINYTGLMSKTTPSIKPVFVSDYVRHMNLFNEAAENIGSSAPYQKSAIDLWTAANADPNGLAASGIPNYIAYPNTQWGDWIYTNGWLQNHNVSVNGGGETNAYLISARVFDNPGIMHNTGLKRYEMRINLESKITDFLTVGTQTFGLNENADKGNVTNLYTYLRQTVPGIYPMYNGMFGGPVDGSGESTVNNLLAYLYESGGKDMTTRLNSTVYANVKIMKGLSFETKFNYQVRFDETTSFTNPYARYDFSTMNVVAQAAIPANMTVGQGANKLYRSSFDNVLRYNNTFDKHTVGAILGYNQFYYNSYTFNASQRGLIDASLTNISTGTEMVSVGGTEIDNAMRSFFGRVNYDYDSKYLAEFSLRRDGASKFGFNHKYGMFPSAAVGWNISKEGFMHAVDPYIQNIKLRGSWGKLGNDGGDATNVYAWLATYGSVNYSFGGSQVNGLSLSQFGNDDLMWEESENKELALEFATFKNRLSAEFNWYNRLTSAILRPAQTDLTAGTAEAPVRNFASMKNTGIELNLNWRDRVGNFSYNIGGNFAFNKNQVTKMLGKLNRGWLENSDGTKTYVSNLGDVSSGTLNRTLEDFQYNEFYLRKIYRGDGSYFNADGSVNVNGGPTTGMIRTDQDYEWAKAMKAAGYSFVTTSQTVGDSYGTTKLYYGDLIYSDLNGDGIYGNANDQYFTGTSTTPKYIFGINLGASYKGFDLSMIWAGEAGLQYYWNDSGYNSNVLLGMGNQITTRIADDHYFYNPTNPNDERTNINGYFPRLKLGTSSESNNNQSSDYWLYNASFLKLRNLQIGYTFNNTWTEKMKIRNLRLYFSGENLLMFTKFPGGDPEIGSSTAKYPTMKQYAFGLNFGF